MEKLKILMVEDLDTDVELIQHAIKKFGFNFSAMVVENEDDYIKAIGQFQPDIILSDYSLPQFNGVRALQIRQDMADSVPFIIVTGSNNEIIAVECMKAGADDYIIKQHLARLGPAMDSAILKHKLMDSEKESLEALRLSEERYKNFVSQVTEGVYRFELLSPMPLSIKTDDQIDFIYHNTRLAECNEAFLKMYRANEFDELANKSFLDFHGGVENPVNRTAVKQLIDSDYKVEDVITAEKNAAGELRYYSNNSIGIIEDGYLLRIWGTQKDITGSKEAEVALLNSETRLRTLLQTIPDLVWLKDKDGIYLSCNRMFERLFGASEDDIIGKTDYDFVDRELADFFRDNDLKSIRDGKSTSNEEWVTFADDGHRVLLDTMKTPMYDSDGTLIGVLGIAHDITMRKKTQDALAENEEKYKTLFERDSDAIFIYDPITTNIIDANAATTKMYGYDKEELINWPCLNFSAEVEESISLIEKTRNHKEVKVPLRKHKKKDGTVFFVEIHAHEIKLGEKAVMYAVSKDITDRIRAEEELLKQKVFFEQMFSQSSVSTQILDKDGWCERINPKLSEIFGVKPEHIEGKVYNIFKDQGIIDGGILPHLEKVFKKGETAEWEVFFDIGAAADSQNIEVKEKKKVWYSNWAYPIFNEHGELTNVIIQHTDISERKNAELALYESEKRFQQVAETTEEWIWEVDESGVYRYCSSAVESILGYKPEELVGKKHFYDLFEANEREKLTEAAFNAFKERQVIKKLINANIDKNGLKKMLETSGAPIINEFGEFKGYRGTDMDVTERILAEEALKDSEERFRNAFQISPDSININRLSDGLYVNVNDGFTLLTGYTKADVEGKTSTDINIWVNPDDRNKLVKGLKKNGMVSNLESKFRKKDGSETTALMSASLLNLDGVPHVLSITRDIQEWKDAKNALEESEKKYRNLYNNIPVGVFKSTADGVILSLNSNMFKIYGYDNAQEFIKRPAESFYSDPSERKNILELIKKERSVINHVTEEIKKDGTKIWIKCNYAGEFNDHGELIGIEGVVEDITQQKDIEEAIRISEEKFRLLAENASDVIWTMNEKGEYLYISPSIKRLRGYTPEEAIKQGINGAMDKKTVIMVKKELSDSVNKIMKGEKPENKTLILELICKNGGSVWTEITTSVVYDDEGKFVSFLGVTRDITERISVENELELHRNNLEKLVAQRTSELDQINIKLRDEIVKGKEVEKLLRESLDKELELNELKSQFVSTVSHEFRTPLTTVLSSIELLKKYGRKWDEEKYLGHTTRAVDSIDRLTSLMDNVLLISRSDSGKIEFNPYPMNLDLFCRGIIEELTPLLLDTHKMIYKYETDIENFNLDEKLFRLILMNLLSNAIKYSPKGGKINLKISKKTNLKIVVSDEGIGIATSDIAKVFDSFYRAEDAYEFSGTGLGLSIVKRSVEIHKGKIHVESKIGSGAKFIIELPVSDI